MNSVATTDRGMTAVTDRVLSIGRFAAGNRRSRVMSAWIGMADRLLGLHRLEKLYRRHELSGLTPGEFSRRAMEVLEVDIRGREALQQRIPATGPCLVVLNHPLGGAEGLALASILLSVREDVQVLTNNVLATVPELSSLFIGANPLRQNAPGNRQALLRCRKHLGSGGLLVIFPAGRVSFRQPGRGMICDQQWHRFVGSLAESSRAPLLPVYITGRNSRLFYLLGGLHQAIRPLLLARELLGAQGKRISFHPGTASDELPPMEDPQARTDHYRLLTYLQDPAVPREWPGTGDKESPFRPIAPAGAAEQLADEVQRLPGSQKLLTSGSRIVCYGERQQIPAVVDEIQRLREVTFRELDEGSGAPRDGDAFDDTYTHLFLFDRERKAVLGAYRMGRTDRLIASSGMDGLYLNRMFSFPPGFLNRTHPCLEMGRSFLVADTQRSYQGLQLLLRGIMAFFLQHPEYRFLYGTVSLSRQYSPLSVALIERMLVRGGPGTGSVRPVITLDYPDLEELEVFIDHWHPELESLDWLVRRIEPDGKGVPVLLKQYHRLDARFHALGIDPNFASTPGLLLSVDMHNLPDWARRRYSRGINSNESVEETA